MAINGHKCGHELDRQQKNDSEMDLELTEIRARMEELAFKMQQSAGVHWVYE